MTHGKDVPVTSPDPKPFKPERSNARTALVAEMGMVVVLTQTNSLLEKFK